MSLLYRYSLIRNVTIISLIKADICTGANETHEEKLLVQNGKIIEIRFKVDWNGLQERKKKKE